jgi:hypothetical protein
MTLLRFAAFDHSPTNIGAVWFYAADWEQVPYLEARLWQALAARSYLRRGAVRAND